MVSLILNILKFYQPIFWNGCWMGFL